MSVMRQGIDFTWESVAEYMDALGNAAAAMLARWSVIRGSDAT